ncbi:MAG: hypothetical protein JNJ73_16175 [Hyphomonadaceae bacterium]|nr:hypothetical protein [Hyphomonadaceae bacterium]
MHPVVRAVPLLVLPAILYALVAFTMGDASFRQWLADVAIAVRLPSGAEWLVTYGHLITMFAAGLFFLEIVKSTRPTSPAIIENSLAMIIFAVCLALFLLVPEFGTMEFFLIMSMLLLDFMAGAIVMIFVARRDVAWGT